MNDRQLARRIVQCFMDDPDFFTPEQRTLEYLFKIDLASAFTWDKTQEGSAFWATLCSTTLRTSEDLHNFLKKNLILEDSNFIDIEFFV